MKRLTLESKMKSVVEVYFISLHHLQMKTISSGEKDELSPFYKFYSDVESAFYYLNKEYQRLINNEFFYQAYPGWWSNEFTAKEFKSKRNKAIRLFLERFYEIH